MIPTPHFTSIAFIVIVLFSYCSQAAPKLEFTILQEQAHDPKLFTQGWILDGEDFIESSGLYGASFIRRYNKDSLEILSEKRFPKDQFAEGLTIVGQHLYVLTWRENLLYVFDKNELKPLAKKRYQGEGWGLCYDGSHFVMSNGSDKLFYRDKNKFDIKRTLQVLDEGKPVKYLNELEYARQRIWANIWQDDRIIQIDPLTGTVLAEIKLTELVNENGGKHRSVLNGIAYDSKLDAFWVTGKNWPKRFLIKIAKKSKNELN